MPVLAGVPEQVAKPPPAITIVGDRAVLTIENDRPSMQTAASRGSSPLASGAQRPFS